MNKINLLLVEDEPVLASIIKESLESRGFQVRIAVNGLEGWSIFRNEKPDICVVDVMMPKKDGFTLVKDIRMVNQRVPIIFLTARTQTEDVLKGLEIGADDYMKKPFSMEELVLRVKGLLRRNDIDQILYQSAEIYLGELRFNYQRLELFSEGQVITLSQRESELLHLLIKHKNTLLDRRSALLQLWGEDSRFNARSMDVYITRLRKFLKNEPGIEIQSVRGQGYKLVELS
jgi:two-component system response regulator TrcR